MARCRVEEPSEVRGAVIARQAQPIDRAVAAHQRGGVAVGKQPVVRDGPEFVE